MKFSLSMTLMCLCLVLTACGTSHYALIPPPGNTTWTHKEDSAIILVGYYSDEVIGSIQEANDGISIASFLFPKNELHVVALHYAVGETFKLVGANYFAASLTTSYSLKFKDLHTLAINEPGIYYYGSFSSRNRKGAFVEDINEKAIAKAKRIYPKVFDRMHPVNF